MSVNIKQSWVALLCTVASLVAVAPTSARADASEGQAAFESANSAYVAGNYRQAATLYGDVLSVHQIDDPALYLNIGNAYFRLNRLGSAIFFYRRGLRLDPPAEMEERLERNLKATRRKLQERYRASGDGAAFMYTEPGGLLFRITHLFGTTPLVVMFLTVWFLLFGLLAWRRLGRAPSGSGPITAGLAVVAVLTGLMVWGQVYTDKSFRLGVVVESNVSLRQGRHPDATGQPIREGVEVRIVESDEEWARVRRSDGAEGWVEATSVKQI